MGELNREERAELAQRVQRIRASTITWLSTVAVELGAIKARRLYLADAPSWEAWCRGEMAMSARRADQLIAAGEIRTVVPIENEAQGRALASLAGEPESLREVWDAVDSGGSVTARNLARAVREREDSAVRAALGSGGDSDGALAELEAMEPAQPKDEKRWFRQARAEAESVARAVQAASRPQHPATQTSMLEEARAVLRSLDADLAALSDTIRERGNLPR